eukprot:6483112-Amphidinium_carterae.1
MKVHQRPQGPHTSTQTQASWSGNTPQGVHVSYTPQGVHVPCTQQKSKSIICIVLVWPLFRDSDLGVCLGKVLLSSTHLAL